MRKLLVLVLVSLLVFGCKKDEVQEPIANEAEVSFAVDLLQPENGLKDFPPTCLPLEPEYAKIVIDGYADPFYPLVFRINGILYTQNIKLPVPDGVTESYTVTEFILYDDTNTPNNMGDDVIVMAAPADGSPWEQYISAGKDLNYTFTVKAFEKAQYTIEVLCFLPDVYTEFGFDWFQIHEIIVREQCFFGDICVKDVSVDKGYAYPGSPYLNQSTGIQLDMPALMSIDVYYQDSIDPATQESQRVPFAPFTNAMDLWDGVHNWGVGAPLCIKFPDHLWIPDEMYYVDIYIWVMDGDNSPPFKLKLFWQGQIDEMGVLYDLAGNIVPAGDDGIIELVLGECNLSATDIQLVPYQNLPDMVDMQTEPSPGPGSLGTYFDVTLSNLRPGAGPYDLEAKLYGVWCGDQAETIYVPSPYNDVAVYGSLEDQSTWPGDIEQKLKDNLDQANWLFNNLDNFPGYTWEDIQNALWVLLDDGYVIPDPLGTVGPMTPLAEDMVDDAQLYGNDYLPPPGGWAAILFYSNANTQLIFTFVDP
jgi:hypothetical protein